MSTPPTPDAQTPLVARDLVRLDVLDDGVGFDPALTSAPTADGGYGLRGLRERLIELGGGLSVESEPGGGTIVSAQLPLRIGEDQ